MSTPIHVLKALKRSGYLRSMDVQLAGLVDRMVDDADERLLLAVALASRAIGSAYACVDLEDWAGKRWEELFPSDESTGNETDQDAEPAASPFSALPSWETWKASLETESARKAIGGPSSQSLFVLNGTKLYLRRYWNYERSIEARLLAINEQRDAATSEVPAELFNRYFPSEGETVSKSRQQQEAATSKILAGGLSILSGGPGTGKTYTLARAVALMVEHSGHEGFVVRLAAPTGKASQRVVESIRNAKSEMKKAGVSDAILHVIPEAATTLHRLLGARYASPYFKHNRENPLNADLVIVDEASMIDLPMMAKLLAAIPDGCRLMLVGDSEQLASVDPGRVYADICHAAEPGGKLSGCLTVLTESRRFPADSPVGKIGKAIQEGGDSAWPALNAASGSRVLTHYAAKLALSEDGSFAEWVKRVAAPFRKAKTPKDVLTAAEQFRVLCALRRGPYGVRQMNERIKRILNLPLSSRFYQYQVILIQVNTPALGLYNGDIGVVFKNPDLFEEGKPSGKLFGWFPSDDPEKPRSIPVNLLPEHETAFAMTVHKSQGSEFSALALVLPPDGASPVLTRELIYTGITRVKLSGNSPDEGIRVYCTEDSFKAAVDRKTVRTSGLFETVRRPLGERASLPV